MSAGDAGERYLTVSDFTASWSRVEAPDPGAPPGLRFDAIPAREEIHADAPGKVVLEVANLAENRLAIEAGASPPFGVVYAVASRVGRTATPEPDGTPPRFLLWRDYAAEGCEAIRDGGRRVTGCAAGGDGSGGGGGDETPPEPFTLAPGETVSRAYGLRWDAAGMGPGRYVAAGRLPYRAVDESSDRRAVLAWTVQFALRERVD